MITNISAHGGNRSSKNYAWKGLSFLPASSLLITSIDYYVINAILFEDYIERTVLMFPVGVSEPGTSMKSAVIGKIEAGIILLVR